jgi:hypothetical protein
MLASPIGKELQTGATTFPGVSMLAAPIYWWEMISSTYVLVRYKDTLNVSRTLPI